ncbi:MAG: HEAT repeat domain-containing protein [Verrucomicrobiales bacterium]|nr:HEAT repeat domain-containing protein [Verrucomicrobiales bacterium]
MGRVLAFLLVMISGSAVGAATRGTEGIDPLPPTEAQAAFRLPSNLKVEVVVTEPLVVDPVAIDWGADGLLWVCEMNDYPTGLDEQWQPGGRVKILSDSDGDGVYDRATLFLDGIPFPTGITAWGNGALISAAPDILYAEDTNGDGRADRVERLFTGFNTENYQARVNSLSLGLDNWIHGANGLLGGTIAAVTNSFFRTKSLAPPVDIRNRDFRFHPRTGALETTTGLTQYGRMRDDWGRWFGCDNSRLLLHYSVDERYLRRNPHVSFPDPIRHLDGRPGGRDVYPASRLLERYNDPDNANRVTSACGLTVYRDVWLGTEYAGNLFICEPVHNLVHREVLNESDAGLTSSRAPSEAASEFLASTDHWFRPAQVRTGPDGALYVVDIYRFLIEHPRWIPAARLSKIEVRAGADRGRIYRIVPKAGAVPRPVRNLRGMDATALAEALVSPNGTERDRVHLELLLRGTSASAPVLVRMASSAPPQVRVQALSVLAGLSALDWDTLGKALHDPDPWVRAHALRLSEEWLRDAGERGEAGLFQAVRSLATDPVPLVRRQLAYSLGELVNPEVGKILGRLAVENAYDAEIQQAVLTAAARHGSAILEVMLALPRGHATRQSWVPRLATTLAAAGPESARDRVLAAVLPPAGEEATEADLTDLAGFLEGLPDASLSALRARHGTTPTRSTLGSVIALARHRAMDPVVGSTIRRAGIEVLARLGDGADDLDRLAELAAKDSSETVRRLAQDRLRASSSERIATRLVGIWPESLPGARAGMLDVLMSRDGWAQDLLRAVKANRIPAIEIPLVDRQRLRSTGPTATRVLAQEVLPLPEGGSRNAVIERYRPALQIDGNADAGRGIFEKQCANCHSLGGVGFAVGPDLSLLRGKDAEYWLKNLLDPNAIVEPRFVAYELELEDGSNLSGLIPAETATGLTLVAGGGVQTSVLRNKVRELRASSLSLMPEGLEQGIDMKGMADLLAFVRGGSMPTSDPEAVLRDPASVARLILDGRQSTEARETAVRANPQFAAALIVEMTRDLSPGTPAEYERIPWLWRVAIGCGRRNDAPQIAAMLAASLPRTNQPLADWQAVVIGGGLINGISERQPWPGERLAGIVGTDPDLATRWSRALDLASAMADDSKVPQGTRYDALRMLGCEPWSKRGDQLSRYLAHGTPEELQLGAVSGLVDVPGPDATAALIRGLGHLPGRHQQLAIDGLMRTSDRKLALLDEVQRQTISAQSLGPERYRSLVADPDATIRAKAIAAFGTGR